MNLSDTAQIAGLVILYLGGIFLICNYMATTLGKRMDDMRFDINARFGDMNTRMDEMRADLLTRMGDMQSNIEARSTHGAI